MTIIRTAKSRYIVEGVSCPASGPVTLTVRQPSGRLRHLTRHDTGTARFSAALAHFYRKVTQ